MKISLVIPAYNEEKYIGDCLTKVIENSQGKFHEIIVVDNGSTDGTKEIVRKFPKVRLVEESHKGANAARQRGFQETTGELIAFIDADTRPSGNWCRAIGIEFARDPSLVCLSGPYFYYDLPLVQQWLVKLFFYFLALPAYLLTGYMAIAGNLIIRRNTLEKMSGFDTSIAFYGDDTDTARRAHAFGRVKFKPSFVMHTSARRFKEEGMFTTGIKYVINFLSIVFAGKPATKNYQDIR